MSHPRRWLIYLVCALGLAFGLVAYVAQWRHSRFAADFPLEAVSFPARIDAHVAVSSDDLQTLAESWPPGTVVTIEAADGTSHAAELVARHGPASLAVTGLSGLVFLATAVFFFAPRSHRPGIGGFFWISFLYGLAIMVGGVYFPRERPLLVTAFSLTQVACLAALPALFLHLSLSFPRRSAALDRHRWLMPLIAASALAVFAWRSIALLRYFVDSTAVAGARLAPAHMAADIYMVVLTLAGLVIFAIRERHLELVRERHQVRWLLWGFCIGAAPYVLLRTLPLLFGAPALMPDYVDRVVELAIPLAFTMAVVRHQFLDIDVIIRRSLLYGLLAASVVGTYLGAGILFGRLLGIPLGIKSWLPPVVLGVGAGMAFLPLRRLLGRWIDQAFFKLAIDRDLAIARLDRDLAPLETRQDVVASLRSHVDRALRPRRSALVVSRPQGPLSCGDLPPDLAGEVLRHLATEWAGGPRLRAVAGSTCLPAGDEDTFPARLRDAGFVLLQPIASQGASGGAILVGSRTNDRRYVEPDLEFLASCARVAAQHLERVGLIRTVAEETLARERLAELNRHKSAFLSHVAHDLRTPVAGISWSARNLADGVVGPLTGDQADYVESIAESAEHLNRLITNLLEVSRLDRADTTLQRTRLSAADVWRQAVRTVEPLAIRKDVRLSIVGIDRAAPVMGDAGKLVEVAINLLDNAVKFTATGTTVTIEFAGQDERRLAMLVRDQGPGLGDQTIEDLVGRFAQGQPSPSSSRKGFGLGLHIAATYLELMGGDLTARDHPDGGAEFVCSLPLAPIEPQSSPEGAPS